MKKTIFAMLLAGTSFAVFAQQSDSSNRNTGSNTTGSNTNGTYNNGTMNGTNRTTNGTMNSTNGTNGTNGTWNNNTNGYNSSTNNSLNNNTSYNAYGSFNATPPDYVQSYVTRDYPTATDVKWQQSADWWHGYYMNNGQPVNTYYNTAGQSFTVALPVRESLVPDAVVSRAISTYGPTLYDITSVKGTNGQDIYMVRTLENGQITSQWMGEDGTKVIDVYRTDENGMNTMNGSMNNSSNMNGSMNNSSNNGTMNNSSNTNGSMNNSSNSNSNNSGSTNQNSQMNSTDQSNASGSTTTNSSTTGSNSDMSSSSGTTGSDASSSSSNTGKDKLKIKTKSSDGKIQKTKVVNGKVTTKGSQNQNQ
ncbi:MAG: hypothetical protein ACJ75B_03035 [Flavisolibacter sp.]